MMLIFLTFWGTNPVYGGDNVTTVDLNPVAEFKTLLHLLTEFGRFQMQVLLLFANAGFN
jgi:hypothetical protein